MEAEGCQLCPRLVVSRRCIVPGFGPLPARVLVLAQAPGREEEVHGRPLWPEAWTGRKLRGLLEGVGINPDEVRYENTTMCRGPKRKGGDAPPTAAEIKNCRPYLEARVAECRPSLIITLGAPALQWFVPKGKLGELHGRPLPLESGVTLWPMHHPAAAAPGRNMGLAATILEDWARLGAWLDDKNDNIMAPVSYRLVSAEELGQLLAGDKPTLVGFDIETTDPTWQGTFQPRRAKLIGLSLSWEEGTAYYLKTEVVPRCVNNLLSNPAITKICHNTPFELVVLNEMGVVIQ